MLNRLGEVLLANVFGTKIQASVYKTKFVQSYVALH
jgi:hypothetical protein